MSNALSAKYKVLDDDAVIRVGDEIRSIDIVAIRQEPNGQLRLIMKPQPENWRLVSADFASNWIGKTVGDYLSSQFAFSDSDTLPFEHPATNRMRGKMIRRRVIDADVATGNDVATKQKADKWFRGLVAPYVYDDEELPS